MILFQESLLLEPMFEIPGSGITGVHVSEDYVKGVKGPIYTRNIHTEASTDEEELKTSIRI